MDKGDFQKSCFAGASFLRVTAQNSEFRECVLEAVEVQAVRFDASKFHYSDLSNARLHKASFQSADMTHCNLHAVTEDGVIWSGARLTGVRRTDKAREEAEKFVPPPEAPPVKGETKP